MRRIVPLSFPTSITVSPAGDVFFVDAFTMRIRRVDHATHVITTIAGDGAAGATSTSSDATSQPVDVTGIAFDASSRDVVFSTHNQRNVGAIHANGALGLVAGGGQGSPTAGGDPPLLKLGYLGGVAHQANGDLLIADPPTRPCGACTRVSSTRLREAAAGPGR